MREITIAGARIADDTDGFVVAEIGHNHGGSVEQCKRLFYSAKECGVDAVKLQKRDNATLFTQALLDQPYNSEHSFGATYGEHRAALEFGWDEYVELKAYTESLGLVFFATAFDVPSADFLHKLDVPAFKIASGDLKTILLIRHVARFRKPVIISTGGGTMDDVKRIACDIGIFSVVPGEETYGTVVIPQPNVAFLQCTAAYPCQPNEMNLRVIQAYRDAFPYTVIGLSDHQDGISLAPVAYALGARLFEKHYTLDHNAKGSDHRFSLEPDGMKRMVRDLKRTREALGDGVKRPYASEQAGLYKMGKSIVAANSLLPGQKVEAADLAVKSPNDGLEPWKVDKLIGRRVTQTIEAGETLTTSGVFE